MQKLKLSKKAEFALDRMVDHFYREHCAGVQIDAMKIDAMFRGAKALYTLGESMDIAVLRTAVGLVESGDMVTLAHRLARRHGHLTASRCGRSIECATCGKSGAVSLDGTLTGDIFGTYDGCLS